MCQRHMIRVICPSSVATEIDEAGLGTTSLGHTKDTHLEQSDKLALVKGDSQGFLWVV